jgi:SAM-dependent methyltransferase
MVKFGAMSCRLCGSLQSSQVQKEPASNDPTRSAAYTQRQINVLTCSDCSFTYVERDFPESYVNGYYDEAAKHSNRHILSLLGPANSRRMLDIDCGSGTFLADAREAGWAMSGLEINAEFPEFCRKELGIEDVKVGLISDPPFPEASFDAVAMLDVLGTCTIQFCRLRSVRVY